jgi:colicin import membrane protein
MLAQSEKAQLTDPSINTVMDPQRTDQAIYTPSKNGDKINTEVSNSSTSIQKSTLDGEKNQPDEHNSTRGYTPSTGAKIYTGPRGGNYYINKNGNKVYIKKK